MRRMRKVFGGACSVAVGVSIDCRMQPEDAMREGARRALQEVLRARRPDLTWEVFDPVQRLEAEASVPPASWQIEAGRNQPRALGGRTASAPDPDGGKRAA